MALRDAIVSEISKVNFIKSPIKINFTSHCIISLGLLWRSNRALLSDLPGNSSALASGELRGVRAR